MRIREIIKAIKRIDNDMYYKAGDTETIARVYTGGYITNSLLGLRFQVPLPKKADNVNVTITGGTINVRAVEGGYLLNSANILDAESINTSYAVGHNLPLLINYSSAFNTVNNSPIGVELINLQLSFSKK